MLLILIPSAFLSALLMAAAVGPCAASPTPRKGRSGWLTMFTKVLGTWLNLIMG